MAQRAVNMLEVQNLSKKFDSFMALDDINFQAQKGEIITLLGPNGAGKSTLMRCICGYLHSNCGKVIVDGDELHDNLIPVLQKLGYMPENTPLYPEMKVLEYMQFIAGIYKMSSSEQNRQFEIAISKLNLQPILNQKIGTLSKGYRRRVGIASAILHQPQLLVLDEPTEGLDPNQKIALRQFLKEYAQNALVIISTHLLEEAEALATRVLIINKGKLIRDTTVKELKQHAPKGDLAQLFFDLTNGAAKNVE